MALKIQQLRPFPLYDRDLTQSEVWDKDFLIQEKERVLVRASSGSGKTTFLSILYGMRKDHTGSVLWEDAAVSHLSRKEWSRIRREEFGMVFQDLKLFDDISVRENLMLKNKLTERFSEERIKDFLHRLDIGDQWEKPVYQLSTGQKQRVAIARALCQPFRLLLLDEPFSHLDRENVERATTLIGERLEEEEAGMLLASLEDPYGLEYDRILQL